MYCTCLYCHAPLGANEAIEHFPVGKRLAFDAARGRLWVVCQSCERWNLTPLEERWEAIEECERAFRDTKLRVSTENVGLCKLRDGTTLVRIGDPQRPEMAAWRYGDQFGRRRRKYWAIGAAGLAGAGGLAAFGVAGGMSVFTVAQLAQWSHQLWTARTAARVRVHGELRRLTPSDLQWIELRRGETGTWDLTVPVWVPATKRFSNLARDLVSPRSQNPVPAFARVPLSGSEAIAAARLVLPRVNRSGGAPRHVAGAVDVLQGMTTVPDPFSYILGVSGATRDPLPRGYHLTLVALKPEYRLALEMSLHESDERRALEGELAELETRWREAEEIAAISDDLLLPQGVRAAFDRLRTGKTEPR